eukprot:135649-Rhodomonas_salina.1
MLRATGATGRSIPGSAANASSPSPKGSEEAGSEGPVPPYARSQYRTRRIARVAACAYAPVPDSA